VAIADLSIHGAQVNPSPAAGFFSDQRSERWYVVQTKPREERRAVDNLERQGYRCKLMTRDTERVRRGVRCFVAEPLFPGYLFIALDRHESDWSKIRSTRGVSRMVRFGDHFPSLSPEVVVAIEQARPQPVPLFKRGERVVVQEGPFTGIEAVYVEPDGEARVMILLRMLGSEQAVSLPLNILSLAR